MCLILGKQNTWCGYDVSCRGMPKPWFLHVFTYFYSVSYMFAAKRVDIYIYVVLSMLLRVILSCNNGKNIVT